jgi:hypothetical protein
VKRGGTVLNKIIKVGKRVLERKKWYLKNKVIKIEI